MKTAFIFKWVKEHSKSFLLALIIALIIKMLFVDAFKIPTGSMENTLVPGDFILVNKAAFHISTPKMLPVFNYNLPYFDIIKTGSPKVEDIIVFEFPGYLTELSPKPKVNYIKRVCGLPGDTIQIINKKLFVNRRYVKLTSSGLITDTSINPAGVGEDNVFLNELGYNSDNYGPIRIPQKGDILKLDYKNIQNWEMLINREYGKKVISVEGTVITLLGKPIREYTIKQDYYFVMGDNRDNSLDSRYWGFVPDNNIVGQALLIYWSWNGDIPFKEVKKLFASIKFDRIFKIIR